jgi:CRISPR-associated endonuclease/helicase Cas3
MKESDFRGFFRELHDQDPFPWQARLAEEVSRENVWPEILDLPTGSGKTACIDVAVFHWLVCAERGAPHDASRRVAFVVDRRIIVDEAAERARRIAKRIAEATSPLLSGARKLLEKTASGSQIHVVTLRGGVERERNLARDPTALTVVLSTVDQLGSRLLFRGYGVTDSMSPLHAGLFGVDTLLLLDEAHIAEPFQQTLEAIVREQRRSAAGRLGPKSLAWAQLSATPKAGAKRSRVFALDADDRVHPVLARRLEAKKPMQLFAVDKRDQLPKKIVDLVVEELRLEPLAAGEMPRVGVVVNRVASARAIHTALERTLKGRAEVELVIGRVRPVERDARMEGLAPKLKSSTSPRPGSFPIVVVATQTIEVGADFDFHAMFIEAAGYASVKQRVGRLNRLGVRPAARGAIVLVREDAEDDPVYGSTTAATWALLERNARDGLVDLGIEMAPPAEAETSRDPNPTPILSPSLIGLLVQTQPRPAVEPNVSEFLHGFATEVPDVSVVWRDGLTGVDGGIDHNLASEVLDALPALSAEAMSLPFSTFLQWARGWDEDKATKITDTGDLDGDYDHAETPRESSQRRVLVVYGDAVRLERLSSVKPGSKVVLPTSVGGADHFGFAPESKDPVVDMTLLARDPGLRTGSANTRPSARAPTLIWTPAFATSWLSPGPSEGRDGYEDGVSSLMRELAAPEMTRDDARDAIEAWARDWRHQLRTEVVRVFSAIFPEERRPARCEWLEVDGERRGVVLRAGKPMAGDLAEYDGGLQRTVNVSLASHSRGVADYAEKFAQRVGLSPSLVRALRTAGYVHDLGKADPRFQARLGARPGELLAKSVQYDRRIALGERHEAYSVAILDQHPELLADNAEHASLIRYLVGTHHGFGRGLQPQVDRDRGIDLALELDGRTLKFSGKPGLGALGSGWTDLFVELHRQYGPWGLAYLESLLRLADHRRSEDEISLGAGEEERGEA